MLHDVGKDINTQLSLESQYTRIFQNSLLPKLDKAIGSFCLIAPVWLLLLLPWEWLNSTGRYNPFVFYENWDSQFVTILIIIIY